MLDEGYHHLQLAAENKPNNKEERVLLWSANSNLKERLEKNDWITLIR